MSDTPFDAMLQNREKTDSLRSSVAFGLTQNPDEYAKARKLAAKTGARPAAVLDNRSAFERAGSARDFDFDAFIRNTPRLATWATDPDNAAISHDDFTALQNIEDAANQVWQVPQRAVGSVLHSVGGGMRMAGTLAERNPMLGRMVSLGLVGMSPEDLRLAGEDVQNYYKPLFESPSLQAYTPSGKVASFAGGIAGAMGKAMLVAPLGPAAVPLLFGGEAFGSKAGQALDTGATPGQATVEATGSGALNAALGILPGGAQNQTFLKALLSRTARGAVLGAGVTVGENLLTRIHQSDQSLTQGLVENVAQFLGMEAAGGLHEHFARMANAAAESKVRARDGEKFKEATGKMLEGTSFENALVPAEAFKTYFQSQGLDPLDAASGLGAKNYVEALAAGTDVVIPSKAFLALEPKHVQGLLPDTKQRSSDMTPREMEAYKKEAQKIETEVRAQSTEAVKEAQDPAYLAIKEDTFQKLVAAGDDKTVAETRATIHAAAMVNLANRAGMDPLALQEAYGLQITRPGPGETGSIVDRVIGRLSQLSGADPVRTALENLGIDSNAGAEDIRAQVAEKAKDPEMGPGIEALGQAIREGGQEFFQRGGGRWANAAEKKAWRAKRLGGSTQAAQDKAKLTEMQADEAGFAAFEADIKALQAGEVFAGGEKQGFIQFGNDRKVQIGFLEKANLSTFAHETGHMYVEILHDLAGREGASQQVKDDLTALRKFAGAESETALTEAQHEKLARANEAYLLEGKAPSEGLRGAFQRVKFWMLQVYRNIAGLGVKLNNDVRGVFDRIYASDLEIEQARREAGVDKPFFTTAEEMGLTQNEFDIYAKKAASEVTSAKEDLAARMVRDVQREREAWWKTEAEKVREEVTGEVDGDAVYQAFKALTDGKLSDGTPVKLNKEALIRQFGEDAVKELPRSFQRLYSLEGGMDAESAAEFLRFRSGDALFEGLRNMESRKARIERLTHERMVEAHGDLASPQAIADAAQQALHDGNPESKLIELKAIRKLQRDAQPVKGQALKDQARAENFWARGVIAEIPSMETFHKVAIELIEAQQSKDFDPHRYLIAQRKASGEAFAAMGKKDYGAAGDAKQREILNHFLYREALKGKAEVEKAYDFVQGFGRKSTREWIAKAGGDKGQQVYLDQIDNVLEHFQFVRESNKAITARQSLAEFVAKADGSEGMLDLDPMLYTGASKNYRELTLPELRAVVDGLKNLKSVARGQYQFDSQGKSITFHDAVEELVITSRGNLKTTPLPLDKNARSFTDKAVSTAKLFDSSLVKMEQVIDILDGHDINGPWRRYVFEPICEAQFKEYELNQEISTRLAAAMEAMPKEQRLNMLDVFDIPNLGRVTRKWVLSMALNTGNGSNRDKMMRGMGWADPVKTEAMGKALDKLNRADWEFVQKTWDTIGTLWPKIEALELRMSGIAPVKVEVKPFQVTLADGSTMDLQGGYYPVVYAPETSGAGARQADVEIMTNEGGWKGPVTSKDHTKKRIESAAYPFLLDFETVLARHINRVIKDLSHREAAMAVAKLIKNQDVRAAVSETLGAEYEGMLMPWLKGTVNDVDGVNSPELAWWRKTLMGLRSNVVLATLGFRASSVLVQVTDLGRVLVGEHAVSSGHMARSLATYVRHPIETIQTVRGLSKEMLSRSENLDRDARAMFKRLQGKDGALVTAQQWGMKALAVADTITSTTSWLAAFNQATAQGIAHPEAVKMADRVVRLKLMSGAPKDLTALQRTQDIGLKFATMFMGDAVATYGIVSQSTRNIAAGHKVAASAFAAAVAAMVIPLIGDLIKGRGPDDEDDRLRWLASHAAYNLPSSVPILRDVVQAWETGQDYRFSPFANAVNKAIVKPFHAATSDKELEWGDWFLTGVESIGLLGGIPGTSQAVTTGKYLRDVSEGKQNPETPWEFVKNVVLGPPIKKKGH